MKNSEVFKYLPKSIHYFLITSPKNIRFLTGFTGDWSVLLLSRRNKYLLTDSRFTEQAEKESSDCIIVAVTKTISNSLKSLIRKTKKVAFEENSLRYGQYREIKKILKQRSFIPTSGIVDRFRLLKTKNEISYLSKAAKIADIGFREICKSIRTGKKEIEIASELEYILRRNGSTAHPFPTISITSANTSLPHGQPGMKKIKRGDLFLLDFGATYNGYCSDITRTVVVGKATKKQQKIYSLVLSAQLAALKTIEPGKKLKEVDRVARECIARAGYEKNFGHGLGHGIGLEVHEAPGVSSRSKDVITDGMVFTIEPGIYIPNWGGVRIEDDVAIVNKKVRILTCSPKMELMEL